MELELLRELSLLKALREGEILSYYQPIIEVEKLKNINKYELLARIKYKNKIYMPNDFIPLAEKYGEITKITDVVLKTALEHIKEKNVHISVNLAKEDIMGYDVLNKAYDFCRTHGIDTSNLTFEILENVNFADDSNMNRIVSEISNKGFKISIDDFGVSNSNLDRFLAVDYCDYIKIDGVFIKDIVYNKKKQMIVQTLVDMAHKLGMKVVAEYVENEEIYQLVKHIGADYIQGYYISKPLPSI